MVLELHIWGPAFGLPSFDAQSLATVAYFVQCVPGTEWRLIPSSDPSVSPTNELPALRIDSVWTSGFRTIINALRQHSSGEWDLDRGLNEKQRADCTAFSSFIESRGQPLLNLSLFVSSENYTEWTRPAFAQILQWPSQWIIPHQLRDEAKRRSEHLGLSSLDIETATEEDGVTNSRGARNIPRDLVARPKETVVSMLGKSGGQTHFRLDAVTSDVLEPLCDLVQEHGSRSWVFESDKASSLDCLLLGYLSLMSPPLTPPHRWLQNALSTKYPVLLQWTTNFRQECFGGPVNAADVVLVQPSKSPSSSSNIPWQSPAPISTANIGLTVLAAVCDSLPVILSRSDRIVRAAPPGVQSGMVETSATVQTMRSPQYTLPTLVCAAFGAAIGYGFYAGSVGSSKRTQQTQHSIRRGNGTNQRDFGEAGRMLGLGVIMSDTRK